MLVWIRSHPVRAALIYIAAKMLIMVFVSIALFILLSALLAIAGENLSLTTGSLKRRERPRWRVVLFVPEYAVYLGLAAFAFARVPLGLLFYLRA